MLCSLVNTRELSFHSTRRTRHNGGGYCYRWTILERAFLHEENGRKWTENYEWNALLLVRKWCREHAAVQRCISIAIKLQNMQVCRLAKASIFAARTARSGVGLRSISSYISRLFGVSPSEPKAKRVPRSQTVHGAELQDDFHWLKDRGSTVSY